VTQPALSKEQFRNCCSRANFPDLTRAIKTQALARTFGHKSLEHLSNTRSSKTGIKKTRLRCPTEGPDPNAYESATPRNLQTHPMPPQLAAKLSRMPTPANIRTVLLW